MAVKPTKLPRIGDVSGVIVEPSSAKKDTGFKEKERIGAAHLMWYLNLLYQWTQYLDDLASQAFTWTGAHVFSNISVTGPGVKHGDREKPIHASASGGVVACTYVNSTSGYWTPSAPPSEVQYNLDVPVGSRIKAFKAFIRDTGSNVTADIWKSLPGGTPTKLGTTQTSGASSSDQTLSHTLATPETVVTGYVYFMKIAMSQNGMRSYGGSITYDKVA